VAPPPHGTIVAAIDQLHHDANAWRDCAGQLSTCSTIADSLGLGGYEFSYAADKAGLQHTYLLLQQKMSALCDEAAANFENVGGALDLAADGYDHDERAAVHDLHKSW
jgi:hypothetical protein